MRKYILLKYYIVIWILYLSIIAFLPASHINGSSYESIGWLIGFVAISSITCITLSIIYGINGGSTSYYGVYVPSYLNAMMFFAIIFSIISVCFVLYDRAFIQGVDYSKGIAFAREQWRILGESRSGFSSMFSLFGNLLSGFPIVLTTLLYLYYDELNKKLRFFSLLTAVVTVSVSVFLTGGRSIVMIVLLTLVLIGLLRKYRGLGVIPREISKLASIIIFMIIVVALIYTVYVFHLRALAGGNSSQSYLFSTLNHLGGTYTGETSQETAWLSNIWDYLYITGAYIGHSSWTFQSILELDTYEGTVTFNFYRTNLARVFDIEVNEQWEFSGLFSTYVGAFYYDYGLLGAILSSLLIGLLLFISILIINCKKLNLFHLGCFLSFMYVVMLSPLLFAADILSFPFILFNFCLLYLISALCRIRFF